VQIAVLVRSSQARDVQDAVSDQAARWAGRVDLRLLGPMAAYDFVATKTRNGV
jgi:Gas vesicle synthesis protein GvpL/GvpF